MDCFGSEKGNIKVLEVEREMGWEGERVGKEGREIIFAEQPVFFRMTKRKL